MSLGEKTKITMKKKNSNFHKISTGIVYSGYLANTGIALYTLINFNGIERRTSIAQAYLQGIFVSISTLLMFLIRGVILTHTYCNKKNEETRKRWEKYELKYTAFTLTLYLTSTLIILGEIWFFLIDNVQDVNNLLPILLISQLMINGVVFAFNFLMYQEHAGGIAVMKKGSLGNRDSLL